MKIIILKGILLILMPLILSCDQAVKKSSLQNQELLNKNMLSNLSNENLADFKWLNEPGYFNIENGTLTVLVDKGTDFFNNPVDSQVTATAPLLFKELRGDFIAIAWVQPDFSSQWNAVALMVHIDTNHWIKFAFENSDATGKSIVSVVTNKYSDDANGVVLKDQDQIWLKLIRKDDIYSMHWSIDGEEYKMARLTAMPSADTVKIGIEAQCPVGESATHEIGYFEVVETTVKDLRKGV